MLLSFRLMVLLAKGFEPTAHKKEITKGILVSTRYTFKTVKAWIEKLKSEF